MKIKKRYDRLSGQKCFYDFPSTNYQHPHKKFNSSEKNYPPPHPRKLQPPPALAPPPPPQSEINNANSNAFKQLHKKQKCKHHLPPISPFSFFRFSSKNNFCVWGEWILNPVNPSPICIRYMYSVFIHQQNLIFYARLYLKFCFQKTEKMDKVF